MQQEGLISLLLFQQKKHPILYKSHTWCPVEGST